MPAQTRLAEPQFPLSDDRGNCRRTVADAEAVRVPTGAGPGGVSFPGKEEVSNSGPRSTRVACLAQAGPCCDVYSPTRRLSFARPILRRIT